MKYQMNTLLWGIEITSYKLHLNLLQIVLYTKAPDTVVLLNGKSTFAIEIKMFELRYFFMYTFI